MPSLSLLLPASTLLALGLCWSVNANPTERTLPTGSVTNYFTPITNLSLDKLVGHWYVAEYESSQLPPNITGRICLQLDFRYNDNGTLLVESISLLDGIRTSPLDTFPVSENGVWDAIYLGVSGEALPGSSHLVVHVDDSFLAVVTCRNGGVKDCQAYLLVRHLADADREDRLGVLHRQLANAGVHNTDGRFVRAVEPCKSLATSAQSGASTPDTE